MYLILKSQIHQHIILIEKESLKYVTRNEFILYNSYVILFTNITHYFLIKKID